MPSTRSAGLREPLVRAVRTQAETQPRTGARRVRPVSVDAAARALLRTGAVAPRIAETLQAAAVPPPPALGQLAAYFADPAGLCRAATADFPGAVRAHDAAFRAHLEATVAEIGTEARTLRESTRPGAIALMAIGGVFAGGALLWIAPGLPGLSANEARLVVAVALACGAVLAGLGGYRLWRGERTTMILSPEALAVPGLDRPIPWTSIADLDMTTRQNGVVTRLLLPPEAPFPQAVPGGRKVKLDAGRGIVTITAGLPYRMSVQDFADLIGRYRHAAEARRVLAESVALAETVAAASPSSPTPRDPVRS